MTTFVLKLKKKKKTAIVCPTQFVLIIIQSHRCLRHLLSRYSSHEQVSSHFNFSSSMDIFDVWR